MITINVGSLVVISSNENATMYKVAEASKTDKFMVGLIDATIEKKRPNQHIQWVDSSCISLPNGAQLAKFISLVDR